MPFRAPGSPKSKDLLAHLYRNSGGREKPGFFNKSVRAGTPHTNILYYSCFTHSEGRQRRGDLAQGAGANRDADDLIGLGQRRAPGEEMAGREGRMAGLKEVVRQLCAQLETAGLTPVADDPLMTGRED